MLIYLIGSILGAFIWGITLFMAAKLNPAKINTDDIFVLAFFGGIASVITSWTSVALLTGFGITYLVFKLFKKEKKNEVD